MTLDLILAVCPCRSTRRSSPLLPPFLFAPPPPQERLKERRAEAKAASAIVLAKQQAQVMYTVPAELVAGQVAVIRYNPNRTVLKDSAEVYVRGGYNRRAEALRLRCPCSFGRGGLMSWRSFFRCAQFS